MLQIIALFCPGLLSMEVFEGLGATSDAISKRKLIQRYASFTLLDVTTAIVVVKLFHRGMALSVNANFTDGFLNGLYFIAVVVAAIFWGYAVKVLSTLIQIKVESLTIAEVTKESHEA